MSRTARVQHHFGGGVHAFRLGLAELEELDELCGVGPGYLLGLVTAGQNGNWKARQLREVIRLGLIGGGCTPIAAAKIVERYFDRTPLGDNLLICVAILGACVVGVEDDTPGELDGEANPQENPSLAAVSASPTSSELERLVVSILERFGLGPSGSSRPPSPAGAPRTRRKAKTA